MVRTQGGEWQVAQLDSLSGLGAAEIPAWGRRGEDMDPLARAPALLALTAAPRTMPCRESERAAITAFVEESLTVGLYNMLCKSRCACHAEYVSRQQACVIAQACHNSICGL